MESAAQSRTFVDRPAAGANLVPSLGPVRPEVIALPVLRRSASLLKLLFSNHAIDLELASAVINLDPGLTFGILQLANRHLAAGDDCLWAAPLALVSAGRRSVEQLLHRAPTVEQAPTSDDKRLLQLISAAVTRASVAYLLARELGGTNPRKAFLAGLLFDLEKLAQAAFPTSGCGKLRSAMCRVLPADVLSATREKSHTSPDGTEDLLAAVVALAHKMLEIAGAHAPATLPLEELAQAQLGRVWMEIGHSRRVLLAWSGCNACQWVRDNLHRLDPWEFMSRLEGHRLWEQICKAYAR